VGRGIAVAEIQWTNHRVRPCEISASRGMVNFRAAPMLAQAQLIDGSQTMRVLCSGAFHNFEWAGINRETRL
jgi:hypothetical protein